MNKPSFKNKYIPWFLIIALIFQFIITSLTLPDILDTDSFQNSWWNPNRISEGVWNEWGEDEIIEPHDDTDDLEKPDLLRHKN